MKEDYSDVLGQNHVKRALTIAAAGMHNISKLCNETTVNKTL